MTISQVDTIATSEVSGSEWLQLMWGFLWRGIVFTIACMVAGGIAGAIVGAVIGMVMGIVGATIGQIRSVTGTVGFILGLLVGFLLLRFYIAWLLQGRYGTLRLALVRA